MVSVKLGVQVGIPCERCNVHGVIAVVFEQKVINLSFLRITGVDVFADVVDGVVVQKLVGGVERVALIVGEGGSIGASSWRVVGGFTAKSCNDLLNAPGLSEASSGIVSFIGGVEQEGVDGLVLVVVPRLEVRSSPNGIGDQFGPAVSSDPFGITLFELEPIRKSSFDASRKDAPHGVGLFVGGGVGKRVIVEVDVLVHVVGNVAGVVVAEEGFELRVGISSIL